MTAQPITADVLQAILAELRGLRADLRRQKGADALPLVNALENYFGEEGRFTVAGLLMLADDLPHCEIATEIAARIDMNSSKKSRATQLGRLLARLPEIETAAQKNGSAVFRLRRDFNG